MELKGKTCIVTGSARGIGKGIGLRRASEGGIVIFAGIEPREAAHYHTAPGPLPGTREIQSHLNRADQAQQPEPVKA